VLHLNKYFKKDVSFFKPPLATTAKYQEDILLQGLTFKKKNSFSTKSKTRSFIVIFLSGRE